MLLGLKDIHSQQINHRDIKLLNVFLTQNNVIKIGDFGISKKNDGSSETVGTIHYMAPEVVNAKPYSPESDVWSLGCLLYELCTMNKPFKSEGGQLGIMSQILTAEP